MVPLSDAPPVPRGSSGVRCSDRGQTVDMDDLVALAERIARAAHDGQTDKAGMPYAEHPARFARRVADDPYAVATAWLHDVLEDSAVTAEDLLAHGIPERVVAAVQSLTRRADHTSADYYATVAADPLALRVKYADLADNCDPERLAVLKAADPQTAERLQVKYAHATSELRRLSGGV